MTDERRRESTRGRNFCKLKLAMHFQSQDSTAPPRRLTSAVPAWYQRAFRTPRGVEGRTPRSTPYHTTQNTFHQGKLPATVGRKAPDLPAPRRQPGRRGDNNRSRRLLAYRGPGFFIALPLASGAISDVRLLDNQHADPPPPRRRAGRQRNAPRPGASSGVRVLPRGPARRTGVSEFRPARRHPAPRTGERATGRVGRAVPGDGAAPLGPASPAGARGPGGGRGP